MVFIDKISAKAKARFTDPEFKEKFLNSPKRKASFSLCGIQFKRNITFWTLELSTKLLWENPVVEKNFSIIYSHTYKRYAELQGI